MKNIMEGETELTEELYEKMMGEWMQGSQQQEHLAQMNQAMSEWGKTWD
jgi:hypothetical protein